MKKTLIVSIGIILILIVLCVWLYLLFFGTPKNGSDVFTNLGFEVAPRATTTTPLNLPITASADSGALPTTMLSTEKALRQLTLRPVAGFGYVGSSSDRIRYVERGTGHVYEINTAAGTEERISGTTIPQVVEAEFSPSGEQVVLIAESGVQQTLYTGFIDTENEQVDYLVLPDGASDPAILTDGELQYIVTTDIGSEGYRLTLENRESLRLFSIPLKDITMLWGSETYLYNKPTRYAMGSLYKVNGGLTAVLPAHFGFVGGLTDTYYLSSYNKDGIMVSYVHNKELSEDTHLVTNYIPEKCIPSSETRVWCASPYSSYDDAFLEAWYRGETQSEDSLWIVDITRGQAQLMVNFLAESGRTVDVDRITIDNAGYVPIFRNKIDNSLWMYDTRN